MPREVAPRTYFLIVAAIFVAMVVVTVVVFLSVERAAHHIPGARPDLSDRRTPVTTAPQPESPPERPQPQDNGRADSRDHGP